MTQSSNSTSVNKHKSIDLRRADGWSFRSPNGDCFLPNPVMFAVYSPSGNQWRKLMYFPDDWCSLNLLLSTYDIYCADPSIIRDMCRQGLRSHMAALYRHMGERILQTNLPQYQDYHKYIDLTKPFPHRGLLMLDSGGFSFGQPQKLRPLLASPFPNIRRFARLMLAVNELENQPKWNRLRFSRLARLAQRIHLRTQLKLQPDIVVTLDRVMHFDLPGQIKVRRVFFNLTCARMALEMYARTPEPKPLLFAVLHPLGPSPSVIGKQVSNEKAAEIYAWTFARQIKYLLNAEAEIGLQFGGFAVGSLVPINDYAFLALLASALHKAITQLEIQGRPLHAFGAADRKAVFLYEYGFTSFDSNLHMVKARNRQIFDPSTGTYRKMQPPSSCSCPVCRRHSPEELLENRQGMKEVATVLQSLHNFYTNHLAHLNTMRQLNKKP